tara:strand:- start:40 stop:375 length:336 start_codon:yes stop_codon:yes gene_type:complete
MNHKFKKKTKFKLKSHYHQGTQLRTYKYIILWERWNKKEWHQIKDAIEIAQREIAAVDSVYKTGGIVDGNYQAGEWVHLWQLPRSHPFREYISKFDLETLEELELELEKES